MKRGLLFLLMLAASCDLARACSSAVISGRATLDGRPLLWKHRDAKPVENHVIFSQGEKYSFIGVVETSDVDEEQVWMGGNSAGFSIMNNAAYNLDKGETYKGPMDQEGYMMKEALGHCATLGDFEKMLEETQGQRGSLASFGVIDARGGAAYYEVSPDTWEKYDASDPKQAPAGYLIRTNFGFSGETAKGSGYIRYQTLEELFFWGHLHEKLTPEFLLQEADRSLKHCLLEVDWRKSSLPENAAQTRYVILRDYIVRTSSVSTMVAQGVKPDEDPQLATLWMIPGFPLTTLTVPLWVGAGDPLPAHVVSRNGDPALLAEKSMALKKKCFPFQVREGMDYLDLAVVLNKQGDGILQKILSQDQETIDKTNEILARWRENGFSKREAHKHYRWLERTIPGFYENGFTIEDE